MRKGHERACYRSFGLNSTELERSELGVLRLRAGLPDTELTRDSIWLACSPRTVHAVVAGRCVCVHVAPADAVFPGYLFLWVVRGWWNARWSPGVVRLIMDGLQAHVPDVVINEIRSRERGGSVELPRPHGLTPGMRVRVLTGPLCEQIGLLGALRPHERVLVLLQLLGGQQRVELARGAIEAL
jgi:hypothetical protein